MFKIESVIRLKTDWKVIKTMETKEVLLEENYREQDKCLTEALMESSVFKEFEQSFTEASGCLLYTSPSPRDA